MPSTMTGSVQPSTPTSLNKKPQKVNFTIFLSLDQRNYFVRLVIGSQAPNRIRAEARCRKGIYYESRNLKNMTIQSKASSFDFLQHYFSKYIAKTISFG